MVILLVVMNSNVIDKFPFSTDGNATDVGDLTVSRYGAAGQSSSTHGYSSGGALPSVGTPNTIDKFSFTADGNATDVGDLVAGRYYSTGQSSTTHGYNTGGYPVGTIHDKFTFATDANATDVVNFVSVTRRLRRSKFNNSWLYLWWDRSVLMSFDKFPFSD